MILSLLSKFFSPYDSLSRPHWDYQVGVIR